MRIGVLMILIVVISFVSACGPSDSDLIGSCAEIRQTTNRERARRIGILTEIGVSATELESLHSLIWRHPSQCENYLRDHFAGLSSSGIQECNEQRELLERELALCLSNAIQKPDATGDLPNCGSGDRPDLDEASSMNRMQYLNMCFSLYSALGGEAGEALKACEVDNLERWELSKEDSNCKALSDYMSDR